MTLSSVTLTAPLAPTISSGAISVTVTYTPDINAASSTITLYNETTGTSVTVNDTTGSYTFTGLIPSDTYYATITSIGDGVNYTSSSEGAASTSLTLTRVTLATPAAPSLSKSGTSVTVTYTPDINAASSTITLYNVTAGTSVTYADANTGSHTFTGLIPADVYDATITSIGDGTHYASSPVGATSASMTLSSVTLTAPLAPTISSGATSVTVTYTPDINAASSTITLYNETTGTSVTVNDTTGSYTFTGLIPSDTYYATITSIGDGVNYTSSSEGAASTSLTLTRVTLATPAAPSLSKSGTSVTVTYTPDINAASSTITLYNVTAGTSVTYADANTGSHTFTGLIPADVYDATITSIGDGTHYASSPVGATSASMTLDDSLVDPGLSFTNDPSWSFDDAIFGSGLDNANLGDPYTAVAVAVSTGVISYSASGCTVDPVSGAVTFTDVGSCTITATITAAGGYAGSSAELVIDVAPSDGGLTQFSNNVAFSAPPASPAVGGTYVVNASATSGGTVTLSLDPSSSGCSLAGSTVTFTGLGTCVIDAVTPSTTLYLVGTGSQSVVIASLASQLITFTSTPPATPVVGSSYTVSATAPGGTVAFSLDTSSQGCSLNGATVTFNGPGTCIVDANVAANGSYAAAGSSQRFTITIRYTVVYNPEGGSVSPTQATYVSGASALTLPTPTYSGYTFVRWSTAPHGGTSVGAAGAAYSPSGLVPTITLYAVWSANSFIVNYNAGAGTVSSSSATYLSGNPALILPSPTYASHTFAGWYTMLSGGIEVGAGGALYIPSLASITLYAHWTSSPVIDTVNFNNNNGQGSMSAMTGADGTSILLPGAGTLAAPTGYGAFAGWSTSSGTNNSVSYNANASYVLSGAVGTTGSAVTLYAVWIPSSTGGAPVFTSSYLPFFAYGIGGTEAVTVTGEGSLHLSSSTLPAGVSFVDNGGGNGTLTLNSTTTLPGTYKIVFTATNSVGTNTQIYTFVVASPYAPTNVEATSDLNRANSVTVTWTAPVSGSVSSYTIQPIDATTGIDGAAIAGLTSTSIDIGPSNYGSGAGLIGGDTYEFVVTAYFDAGGTESSATSNFVLPTVIAPSGSTGSNASGSTSYSQGGSSSASLGTSGSRGSISATAYGQGTVSVAVYNSNPAAGVFSVASGTDSYDVSVSTGSQFSSLSFELCSVGTSGEIDWFDSLNGTSYVVSPAPVAVSGSPGCYTVNLSPSSMPSVSDATLYGSIFYVPGSTGSNRQPSLTSPADVAAVAGNESATVTWTDPTSTQGVTGYVVTASPGGVTCTVNNPAATSCVVTGLMNGTSYTFTVTDLIAGGVGAASSASSSVIPSSPPADVAAVAGNESATVTWTDPTSTQGVTGYVVTASPGGVTCTVNNPAATSCVVTGLMNGTSYTFTVTDLIAGGVGATSSASSSVIPASVVKKPTTARLTLSSFASDSSKLTSKMKSELSVFAAKIIRDALKSVTVTGFSDSRGSFGPNLVLGLTRANAVALYLRHVLKAQGYKKVLTLHVKSLGEKSPVKSNATAVGRAANRRVVVAVTLA